MPLLPRVAIPSACLPLAVALAMVAAAPDVGRAQAAPTAEPRRSGPLYDRLARADSLLFDALFARCDAGRALALLADDVEFYDDRSGLSEGEDLREDFRRLTASCPAGNGVRRILLPGSVAVYPVEGFGAVQTGVHHFVERGASTSTVARFLHVWKREGDGWKLARIVSLHDVVDAERAAELRRLDARDPGERP